MGVFCDSYTHDEAHDSFLADSKMLATTLNGKRKTEIEEASKEAQNIISRAATTRLEFKMMNCLTNMPKEDAKAEIATAEREFSTKFRLPKDSHVHASILKKRGDLFT